VEIFRVAALSLGGILGVQGIVVAHELTHRTEDPIGMFIGRWTFALMFGTNFATEHVHGHHRNLGFRSVDPVTVRRGTGFYTFLTKGAWDQWVHGWEIEHERLRAAGKWTFSLNNQIVRAWIRGALVTVLVAYAAGAIGLLWYLLAIAYAKFILEGLNYFSHYGVMRERGHPIGVRHTFSSNNAIGNMILLNLGRHGAHHADGVHYQDLKAYPDMPQSPYGYLVMTVVSWVPPLFKYVMAPTLKEWEEKYATAAERSAVERDNWESGAAWLARSPVPSAEPRNT
jgi:alkane 1-monooxygenase